MSSKRRKISHDTSAFIDLTEPHAISKQEHFASTPESDDKQKFEQHETSNSEIETLKDDKRGAASPSDESCPICLQDITDPALTYPCNHLYDFECIRRWVDQTRCCPLCKTNVEFLVYDIDRAHHKKYTPRDKRPDLDGNRSIGEIRRRRREEEQNRRFQRRSFASRNDPPPTEVEVENEKALQRRRYVYKHNLYASHVGTNRHSNFTSFSHQDLAKNTRNLKRRATMFVRRELQVFAFLSDNVEFTLQYIVEGILTRMDIQSAGTLKLVGDFIGERDARLFLHELRTFLRSPFEDLRSFDRSMLIQYAEPLQPEWESAVAKES